MKIARRSYFKNDELDRTWFENWAKTVERSNKRSYKRFDLKTSLGSTRVWGFNTENGASESLVIFPGARTSALFWDFDRGLDHLGADVRVYLVETNGLPNSSDGNTPDIKSLGYGEWATEILDLLNIDKAFVAGASFGGLVGMKLGIVSPARVKAIFLLNPGCLQPFSLRLKNLYYNLLPIISPSADNVHQFLDKAVFYKPHHKLSQLALQQITDYEVFALTRFKDKTQKPYYMDQQLQEVNVETHLLVGDQDLLFPYRKSIDNAREKIKELKEVKVFENVGHGIETHPPAIRYLGELIRSRLN